MTTSAPALSPGAPGAPGGPGAPAPEYAVLEGAGGLLRALSSPVRMRIVLELRTGDRCVHELVDALALPQPLVSQHLRTLKTADVVAGFRTGREVRYHLVDGHLAHIVVDAIDHARECPADPGDAP